MNFLSGRKSHFPGIQKPASAVWLNSTQKKDRVDECDVAILHNLMRFGDNNGLGNRWKCTEMTMSVLDSPIVVVSRISLLANLCYYQIPTELCEIS